MRLFLLISFVITTSKHRQGSLLSVGAKLLGGFFQPLEESIKSFLVSPVFTQGLPIPGIDGS
jgi:hypothetical protein